ncbi:MFS transporter, partial [Streptomyces sp. NPDC054841]
LYGRVQWTINGPRGSMVSGEAPGSANARPQTGQRMAGTFPAGPLVPVLLVAGAAAPYAATYVLAALLVASLRVAGPERGMLGRISSAFRTLATAGAPLGALLGGASAAAWGLSTPALPAAGLFSLAVASPAPQIN